MPQLKPCCLGYRELLRQEFKVIDNPSLTTYILEIKKDEDAAVCIGALGKIPFKKGTYFYIGSAKKNLYSRIKRHIKREKKLFWHIDYLLNQKDCYINNIWFTDTEECKAAQLFSSIVVSRPIEKFGCSDCRCRTHLFYVRDNNEIGGILSQIGCITKLPGSLFAVL
ncbi:MAG: GIY-YIG nuclease family protein [Deltaproteobacteria bacterium]|nr:GIY-YIG nuclease family protein [Deltaproteobacteria bacterium]